MIPDIDIYRSANVLVKVHGVDAPIQAAMRADAMLDKGDLDGYAVWKRIVKAVEELLFKERPAGVTVQSCASHKWGHPNVACWGISGRAGDVAGESVCSHKQKFSSLRMNAVSLQTHPALPAWREPFIASSAELMTRVRSPKLRRARILN